MSTNFEKYHERAEQFNAKYGLNFSYEEFEISVMKHKNLEEGLEISKSRVSIENQFYLSRFGKMHKKALNNYIDGKIPSFYNEEMLKDYIDLMNGYSAAYREQHPNDKLQPWYNGLKLTNKIHDENMTSALWSQTDYAKQRYLKGELPLREMRAYCEQLGRAEGQPSREQLAAIASYAQAIKQVQEDHPWYYRFIHPVRNNAEQRDAKMLADFVKARVGGTESAYEDFVDSLPTNDPRLRDMEYELKMLKVVETSKMQNAQFERQQKEKIQVDTTDKANVTEVGSKINESPQITKEAITLGGKN